jgi:hypothetical protein
MTDNEKAFKRVNFFRGFLTTEEDWNDATNYHVQNHRLHNQLCHGYGIVPGFLNDLRAQARGKGELAVEIQPGVAIDGAGCEIYFKDPEIKPVNPIDYKLPQTVFVVAKYLEELTDFIAYKENLEFKGHRRVHEISRIELMVVEPDPTDGVELARIHLTKDVKRITDARDALNPGDNEIDLRYAPVAGVVGSRLPGVFFRELMELSAALQEVFSFMFVNQGIKTASDVASAMSTFRMLMHSRLVDSWNLPSIMSDLLVLQNRFVEDIDANHGQYSNRKEFVSLKRHIEILDGFRKEGRRDMDYLQTFLSYEAKGVENLQAIFYDKRKVKAAAATTPLAQIGEKLKVHSKDFKKTITVEGVKLTKIDELDVLEKDSEKEHSFQIVEPRDRYRSRQKLKYPDGTIVEDVGIAYEGGHCEFTIKNVVPGRAVLLLVRTDYVIGDWEAEIEINGKKAGVMRCSGDDRKFRWRNWPFIIESDFVDDVELKLVQKPQTEERDINMFRIWAFQPPEGS